MLPKRAVDVMQAEVGRFFFAIADAIVPVSLYVPRKVYVFIVTSLANVFFGSKSDEKAWLWLCAKCMRQLRNRASFTTRVLCSQNTHEFAADLFPYTVGAVPGASASDWVAGRYFNSSFLLMGPFLV
jgi:hypothetical protein